MMKNKIQKVNRLLAEAFDPMDPTGFFAKRQEHRELEGRVSRCIQYLHSTEFRRQKDELSELGIRVRESIQGRNRILLNVDFDDRLYDCARFSYKFVINFYNMGSSKDPITPNTLPFMAMLTRITDNNRIKMLFQQMFDKIKQ